MNPPSILLALLLMALLPLPAGASDRQQIWKSLLEMDQWRLLDARTHYFDFSRAGDMALSAGPYRDTGGAGGEGKGFVRSNGYFVAIWQRSDDGWRMAADIAVDVPGILSLNVQPSLEETDRAFRESPEMLIIPGSSFEAVMETEARFVSAINYRGGRRALDGHGLENQRVYLPGMAPAIGRDSGALSYGTFLDETLAMDLLRYQNEGGTLAISGEMAYTYGTMNSETSSFKMNYLRLWRFTADGQWKVAVEVLKPY